MRSIFLALATVIGCFFAAPQKAQATICDSFLGYKQEVGNCTIYEYVGQISYWNNVCAVTVVYSCLHQNCCVKALLGCDISNMCTSPTASSQACGNNASSSIGGSCSCPTYPSTTEFLVVLYLANNTYYSCPCVSSCASATVYIDVLCN